MTASGSGIRTPYHYGDNAQINRYENYTYNINETYNHYDVVSDTNGSNSNETLMLAILVVVGTILAILILVIAAFFCRKVVKQCLRIQCHVCLDYVDRRVWDDSHREECQQANSDFLKSLPEPFDIRCPKCLAYLKLMPKWCGKKFHCDDNNCPFKGGMIENHGYNRLNCFPCDYDLCDSCVHKKIFVLTKIVKTGSLSFSSDTCDICDFNVDFQPVGSYTGNYFDYGNIDTGCYVNTVYSSDPPSYREPSPLDYQRTQVQPPYLLSTYV